MSFADKTHEKGPRSPGPGGGPARSTRPVLLVVLSAVALAALAAVAVTAGCERLGRRSAGRVPDHKVAVGSSKHTISVGGLDRTFRLYRPAALPDTGKVALVVMLHGAMGTARQAETTYGWDEQADSERFVVAYPEGLDRSWAVNSGCCGPPVTKGIDDVAFIEQVVATISGWLPIDDKRVYVSGMSNGGMLAYRLICETTLFAAIGAVSTTMLDECPSAEPTSVIHIHGTADPVIPFTGGPGKWDNGGNGKFPVDIDGPATSEVMADWRKIDECSRPEVGAAPPVNKSVASCPQGRTVELIAITGGVHHWPGSEPSAQRGRRAAATEPPGSAIDATETIWQFFANHPKPS